MSYPTYSDLELEIQELEEENKKLKSDLAFKNTMLDNVKAEYENLQEINENLKDKVGELEKEIEELNKMMLFETKI